MKMEFRLIEMFQEVMRRGSATEAARALGVTQPAVSAALARLEKQLGFALFVREGRHIVPTEEAKLFGAEATRAMSGFEGLGDVAASISAATRGSLTIATNPAPAISWLPPIIAEFQKARPDTRIRLVSRSSKEVRELASLDGFDVGLAEAPFIRQDNVARRFRLRMVAAVHAESALAEHAVITPKLLSGERLITVSGALWTDAAITRAFEAEEAEMHVVAECEYIATAMALVANGAGACLVDPVSAQATLDARLITRPFEPAVYYEVGLLRPTNREFSRLALSFVEEVETFLSRFAS